MHRTNLIQSIGGFKRACDVEILVRRGRGAFIANIALPLFSGLHKWYKGGRACYDTYPDDHDAYKDSRSI